MTSPATDELVARFEQLTDVGRALARERDPARLLDIIVAAAMRLTRADGGALYRFDPATQSLSFDIVRSGTLGWGADGAPVASLALPTVPLRLPDGTANHEAVVAHAALSRRCVRIADVYAVEGYDFAAAKRFDAQYGYRTRSLLAVPMQDHRDELIGVLQLVNARDAHRNAAEFSEDDQRLAEALTGACRRRAVEPAADRSAGGAVREPGRAHQHGHRREVTLHERSLPACAGAHDDAGRGRARDNGGRAGPVSDVGARSRRAPSRGDAARLRQDHDTGARRRQGDEAADDRRPHRSRRGALRCTRRRGAARARSSAGRPDEDAAATDAALAAELAAIDDDLAFLRRANIGQEQMAAADIERVRRIGERRYFGADGHLRPLLTPDEVDNLTVPYGTLTAGERAVINRHIETTIAMLESLPWPSHLRRVPEYAGGHHERMDGKGYPRGLTREQMSWQARMMGIADVFEALTAPDRPYKIGKSLSESLSILGRMAATGHVDADLFDVFVRRKVYLAYAQRFMDPAQIDAIDERAIPGYRS